MKIKPLIDKNNSNSKTRDDIRLKSKHNRNFNSAKLMLQ